jgi:hypothetical protein
LAYNFKIKYRKGSKNVRANMLSRQTTFGGYKDKKPRQILREAKDRLLEYNSNSKEKVFATITTIEEPK